MSDPDQGAVTKFKVERERLSWDGVSRVSTPSEQVQLEHWRAWAALYDPYPDEAPDHDNERRSRANWWVEMAEGSRAPSPAFIYRNGDTPEPIPEVIRLRMIHLLAEFGHADKPAFGQIVFIARNIGPLKDKPMHDSQVDFAYIIGRIVNQAITILAIGRF